VNTVMNLRDLWNTSQEGQFNGVIYVMDAQIQDDYIFYGVA